MDFGSLVAIIVCSLAFITIISYALVLYCIDKSLQSSLHETVMTVRGIFTKAIEEQDPGKVNDIGSIGKKQPQAYDKIPERI